MERCAGIGSVMVTVVPVSTLESMAMLPANMFRTTFCTTTSPIPLPSPNALVVEPLQPTARRDFRPAPERFHRQLQAGARRGERVRQFVRDDARQGRDVLKRVGPPGR